MPLQEEITGWNILIKIAEYRTVGIADVYANKLAGIYLHHAAEAGS